jgi:acyl-coenzyme A thioesterase PaaI-like protein
MDTTRLVRLYDRASRIPGGSALFSQVVRFAAPYFRTIPATVESIEPGRAVVRMRHLPWVRNHLGTVHAIALCNLAELAMGMAAEATVPATHRWIPRSMEVAYLAKARGTMTGTATLELPDLSEPVEVPAEVVVTDPDGQVVFTATIRIWITERPRT